MAALQLLGVTFFFDFCNAFDRAHLRMGFNCTYITHVNTDLAWPVSYFTFIETNAFPTAAYCDTLLPQQFHAP